MIIDLEIESRAHRQGLGKSEMHERREIMTEARRQNLAVTISMSAHQN